MAQVTLRINGYAYTIGCKDGEEGHLESMGAEVSRRIEGIRTGSGPSGEARMLVMAALLMADDIFEMRKKVEVAETALAAAEARAATTSTRTEIQSAPDPKLGQKLSRMAQRAEEIAAELEASEGN